jgi:pantothenate kinase
MSDAIHTIVPAAVELWAAELLRASNGCPGRRYLLGVAGIPGSGKSTFAALLNEAINRLRPGVSRLVPMDGFHLPDSRLEEMGMRSRKGSPDTFDAAGYVSLLQQAQLLDTRIHFPIYDRRHHAAMIVDDPSTIIDEQVRIVITEGNYLLLNQEPWLKLRHILDQCWFLHIDPERAQRWLISRHVQGGRSEAEANRRYDHNDGPNTWYILTHSREPDRIISWP